MKETTIREVAVVSGGLTKNAKRDGLEMKRPFLTVANVYANRLELDDLGTIGVQDSELPRVTLQSGDVLMVEGNGSISQLGRAAVWSGVVAGCVHQNHLIKLRPKPGIASKWLLYWLLSPDARLAIERVGSSTSGLHTLSISKVESLPVRVGPLPEQNRIVEAIETHFSRLDAAVALLQRNKANLKRARASVLKAAVEGRLVPTEAELAARDVAGRRAAGVPRTGAPFNAAVDPSQVSPGYAGGPPADNAQVSHPPHAYEPASVLLERILAERRAQWAGKGKYKEPVAPETEGLPDLPEGWVWATVEQVSLVSGGVTKNAARGARDLELPYLRVANVYANELRLSDIETIGISESELPRLRLESGDLLIVEGNGSPDQLGRVAVWNGAIDPCVHQNHLIKARPLPSADPKWLLTWLLSPGGRHAILANASSTSGLHTLSISKVSALPVPLPPLAEQHRIVAEVDRRLSVLNALETTVDTNLARCARLRQAILKRAFEGRLVPPEAPAYEDAEPAEGANG